jgi:hypothetical protein
MSADPSDIARSRARAGLLDFRLSNTVRARIEESGLMIASFLDLAHLVRDLPYERCTPGDDPYQVLTERCGTCSSKHRLLAVAARDSGHAELKLMVGIFRMSEANTPGVGRVLSRAGQPFIPEAHCYLVSTNERFDFTGLTGGQESPFAVIEAEYVVDPDVLPGEKSRLHRRAIDAWRVEVGLSFDDAWMLREECIAALSASHGPA